MDLNKALNGLLVIENTMSRRLCWDRNEFIVHDGELVIFINEKGAIQPYEPSVIDLLVDDWILI
ncbi:hypothetical protein [Citrobacter portucalensis]|uniref:Thoeris anti-defense Tad2 family protein n=1 Tax=Citrobacter portucalensis TaxID=1639133 RepID=UPI00351D688D